MRKWHPWSRLVPLAPRSASRPTITSRGWRPSSGNARLPSKEIEANVALDSYREISITRDGPVLRLTLQRPDVLNAIGERLHAELSTIFAEADRDITSKVVTLTGAGRAFSAGGDL